LLAAIKGEPSVVEYLISKGANTEAVDRFGQTALFHCARLGSLAALKVLVEARLHSLLGLVSIACVLTTNWLF
jgi:ankyrin repeat protein